MFQKLELEIKMEEMAQLITSKTWSFVTLSKMTRNVQCSIHVNHGVQSKLMPLHLMPLHVVTTLTVIMSHLDFMEVSLSAIMVYHIYHSLCKAPTK